MPYCIIETENGWTVVERPEGATAQEVANSHGGAVIDPGPYNDYDDACEALDALQLELDEEDDVSDAPASQAMEGRPESDG